MVYRFTLAQMVKNKSNRVVFGILILLSVLAIPIAGLLLGDSSSAVTSSVEISSMSDYLDSSHIGYETRTGVQYLYSILVLIICVLSTTYIVRSIVEEKASRLVETLMVSVKPLALVFGKILAVMTFMFGMLLLILAAAGLSWLISGQFMDVSFVANMLAAQGISGELLHLDAKVFVVAVISMILAYFLFSLISGLSGAGCSSMEEVDSANMAATGCILIGYLISCMALGGFGDTVTIIMSICPVVSAFTAPAFYIFGDIGFVTVACSWLVQGACIAALLVVTARVYDQLILYRGSRIKMKQILSMAGRGEGGKRK